MSAVEATATACNLLANLVVLRTMCTDPHAPMPAPALALQVAANAAWTTYALLAHDHYLLSTATASLAMQLTSLMLRTRARRTYPSSRPIRLDVSTDELPRV